MVGREFLLVLLWRSLSLSFGGWDLACVSRSLRERRFLRLGEFLGIAEANELLVIEKKPEFATLRKGVGIERNRRWP